MKILQKSVLASIATVGIAASPALATSYRISVGTEHKVYSAPHIGGEKIHFSIRDAQSGAPAAAHFRRTATGKPKDLDVAFGERMLEAKTGVYVVYATPVDRDIIVTVHDRPPNGPATRPRIGDAVRPSRIVQ